LLNKNKDGDGNECVSLKNFMKISKVSKTGSTRFDPLLPEPPTKPKRVFIMKHKSMRVVKKITEKRPKTAIISRKSSHKTSKKDKSLRKKYFRLDKIDIKSKP